MMVTMTRLGVRLSAAQQRNKNWRIFYALCNEVFGQLFVNISQQVVIFGVILPFYKGPYTEGPSS